MCSSLCCGFYPEKRFALPAQRPGCTVLGSCWGAAGSAAGFVNGSLAGGYKWVEKETPETKEKEGGELLYSKLRSMMLDADSAEELEQEIEQFCTQLYNKYGDKSGH